MRDPAAVSAAEKEARRYQIACPHPSGCAHAFTSKALALGLSAEQFAKLATKNVELGVHLSLPDAVREHLEASKAATGASAEVSEEARKAAHEEAVRAAFRRPDGSFRDSEGQRVRQCASCSYGPILANVRCGRMTDHDGEQRGRWRVNNRCLHCGAPPPSAHWSTWPRWTGQFVLGAVPPLVDPDAPPSDAQEAAEVAEAVQEAEALAARGISVSVDDLAREIGRHSDAPAVRALLEELRHRAIDLREFCRRVRLLVGADVLMSTVRGLQATSESDGRVPTAPLRVGDTVRVRASVARPRYEWGGASHRSEGPITSIEGPRCTVDFNGRPWMGVLSEMEAVIPAPAVVHQAADGGQAHRFPHPFAGGWGGCGGNPSGTARCERRGCCSRGCRNCGASTHWRCCGSTDRNSVYCRAGITEEQARRNHELGYQAYDAQAANVGERPWYPEHGAPLPVVPLQRSSHVVDPATERRVPPAEDEPERMDDQTMSCFHQLLDMGFEEARTRQVLRSLLRRHSGVPMDAARLLRMAVDVIV